MVRGGRGGFNVQGGGWKGVEVCSRRNQFHLPPPDHSSVIAAAVMRDNWWDKNPAIRTQVRLGYSCILRERERGGQNNDSVWSKFGVKRNKLKAKLDAHIIQIIFLTFVMFYFFINYILV